MTEHNNQPSQSTVEDQNDPLLGWIADGRLRFRPEFHCTKPTVLTIDLEVLAFNIREKLIDCFKFFAPDIEEEIEGVATTLVAFAVAVCYNRLREICGHFCASVRDARMKPRAPVKAYVLEFPSFLASTLGSIGPIRVEDGPRDELFVFATAANRMNTFGRQHLPDFDAGRYFRTTGILRRLKVHLDHIDISALNCGSSFPTIVPFYDAQLWMLRGTIHPSHYENEDVPRAFLCTNLDTGNSPFPDITFRAQCIGTKNLVTPMPATAPSGVQGAGENDEEKPMMLSSSINNIWKQYHRS